MQLSNHGYLLICIKSNKVYIHECQIVTKYIYSSNVTVLEDNFGVLVLNLSIPVLCYFLLLNFKGKYCAFYSASFI